MPGGKRTFADENFSFRFFLRFNKHHHHQHRHSRSPIPISSHSHYNLITNPFEYYKVPEFSIYFKLNSFVWTDFLRARVCVWIKFALVYIADTAIEATNRTEPNQSKIITKLTCNLFSTFEFVRKSAWVPTNINDAFVLANFGAHFVLMAWNVSGLATEKHNRNTSLSG